MVKKLVVSQFSNFRYFPSCCHRTKPTTSMRWRVISSWDSQLFLLPLLGWWLHCIYFYICTMYIAVHCNRICICIYSTLLHNTLHIYWPYCVYVLLHCVFSVHYCSDLLRSFIWFCRMWCDAIWHLVIISYTQYSSYTWNTTLWLVAWIGTLCSIVLCSATLRHRSNFWFGWVFVLV